MSKEHTCCVTGHRDIPADKIDILYAELTQEILAAIGGGYTHFISGFAAGVDLIFAEIVAKLKDEHPITLEAAIPYPGRMDTPDKTFRRLIERCDVVETHSGHYFKGCYAVRNRYMVNQSSLVIAAHDGRRTGGTAATVGYARKLGSAVKEIRV